MLSYKYLIKREIMKNILQILFSIKNDEDKRHKIITILGLKIKIKVLYKNQYECENALYSQFSYHIEQMRKIASKLQPQNRDECFDRYFIEDFCERNSKYIKGDVLEFAGGETIYSKKYGNAQNVKIMTAISHKDIYKNADYYSDLEDKNTLPKEKFDCIVATQVIMYMENLDETLKNLKSMLKPNGHLILTVPGPLFHHSKNSHHMYSFTEESIKSLSLKHFNNYVDFKCYGNLEYAQYMLFWLKKNPFQKPTDFEYTYTLVIGITAKNEVVQ